MLSRHVFFIISGCVADCNEWSESLEVIHPKIKPPMVVETENRGT
jgi:hypothetical protein